MKHLKIVTSFISPINLDLFINKLNYLPIFIIRHIKGLDTIGKYSETAIHFKSLAPSFELFRQKRDGQLTIDDFKRGYVMEITEGGRLFSDLNRISELAELSGASGVVLMSIGSNFRNCHRSVLADVINNSGYLDEPIKEYGV